MPDFQTPPEAEERAAFNPDDPWDRACEEERCAFGLYFAKRLGQLGAEGKPGLDSNHSFASLVVGGLAGALTMLRGGKGSPLTEEDGEWAKAMVDFFRLHVNSIQPADISDAEAEAALAPDIPLPPGITREAMDTPPEMVMTDHPNGDPNLGFATPQMAGLQVQVQHPTGHGEPTHELGLLGAGWIKAEDGIPRVALHICHADGAQLGVILGADSFLTFHQLYMDAGIGAGMVMVAAAQPTGKPH